MTLDKIDPRYEYAPDVAPSDGLRSTVYDRTHGILFLTSVAAIEMVKEGDYLVTMRAKSIGDLDVDAPASEPVDPPVEPPIEPTPVDPPTDPDPVTPDPDPVPTPPIVGTYRVTDANELAAKLKSAKAGDVIIAADGTDFGSFTVTGIAPAGQVIIAADNPRQAHFDSLTFMSGKNLKFMNFTTWSKGPDTNVGVKEYGITGYAAASGIELEGILSKAAPDSDDYPTWDEAHWMRELLGAALLQGPDCAIRNCRAVGVRFGYGVTGDRSVMEDLQVEGFSGDAYRINNDQITARRIYCGDSIQLSDGNHADALQLFEVGDPLTDCLIEDALFLKWVTNKDNPLLSEMQGLSLFNGPYQNITARRVRVASTAGHGVSFGNVNGGLIEDCHVRSADGPTGDQRFPWIRVSGCQNVAVRNCTGGQIIIEGQVTRSPVDYSTPWNRPAPLF